MAINHSAIKHAEEAHQIPRKVSKGIIQAQAELLARDCLGPYDLDIKTHDYKSEDGKVIKDRKITFVKSNK